LGSEVSRSASMPPSHRAGCRGRQPERATHQLSNRRFVNYRTPILEESIDQASSGDLSFQRRTRVTHSLARANGRVRVVWTRRGPVAAFVISAPTAHAMSELALGLALWPSTNAQAAR